MEVLNGQFPPLPPTLLFWLGLAIVWSMVWKGIALWQSARNSQRGWFITLFLVNTAGILEIIYIFAVSQRKNPSTSTT